MREEEIPHSTNGHSEKRQLTNSSGCSLDDDKLASKRSDGKWAPTNGISFDGRELGRWYDFCCWHIAAPDVYDGTPQLAKADTAFQGASVGQPTEPCLGPSLALCGLCRAALLTASQRASVSKHSFSKPIPDCPFPCQAFILISLPSHEKFRLARLEP